MSDGSNSQLSESDIVEKYNNDPESLAQIVAKTVSITDNEGNQGNSFAKSNPKGTGNCWIIKSGQNFDFLIPKKKYRFTSHDYKTLEIFYNYQEYIEGKTRDFKLIKPAQVFWNGQDWRLQAKEHKGLLNFGNHSLVNEIGDRDLKFDNKLEALKKEIINEIGDRTPQQPNIDLETLIELYNSNPGFLASKSTMVAATRESIEQRRTGFNTPIIFTQTDNDSYWIIHKKLLVEYDYFYLVPKANLIINSRIYQTIEDIFVCQNYATRASNKFQLVQPAIVKLTADSEDYEDMWELVEPGKLNFS